MKEEGKAFTVELVRVLYVNLATTASGWGFLYSLPFGLLFLIWIGSGAHLRLFSLVRIKHQDLTRKWVNCRYRLWTQPVFISYCVCIVNILYELKFGILLNRTLYLSLTLGCVSLSMPILENKNHDCAPLACFIASATAFLRLSVEKTERLK